MKGTESNPGADDGQQGRGRGRGGRGRGGGKLRKRRGDDDDDYGGFGGRNKPLQKPPNQEKLSAEELKEEFIRTLSTADPLRPKNLCLWNYKEGQFISYVDPEPMVTVFYSASELLARDTEQIKAYKGELIDEISDAEDEEKIRLEEEAAAAAKEAAKSGKKKPKKEEEKVEEKKEEEPPPPPAAEPTEEDPDKEEMEPPPLPTTIGGKPKKLLNQFNFCERACQTKERILREHGTQTQPPPQSQYKDMCNQWIIFDAYQVDSANNPDKRHKKDSVVDEMEEPPELGDDEAPLEKVIKEIKKPDNQAKLLEREKVRMRKMSVVEGQAAVDIAFLKASDGLKYAERMVNTNVFEDVLDDFKYFEDNADEYRDGGDGTLLPLWRFSYEKSKKIHVTCISWSVTQPDMFAASYGSFSFVHPVLDGMVVVYTLKNPAYPEFAWLAPKGAMACHIHQDRNCLVCVGLYDGNVAILNLQKNEENESRTEVLKNVPTLIKHRAPVWTVKWSVDDLDSNPTFFSAGMDGRIIHWVVGVTDMLGAGGLQGTEIGTLHLPIPPAVGPDGTTYKLFGCARCLAFHPKEVYMVLVGTAEGNIFRCSTQYGSKFQQIYNAHFLPVAQLQWNHFHDDVFISCSEDWTIKVWDRNDLEPMYVFEIGVPILDVCWAPYSSTVFGACTEEGKVLIYDLNVNKEKPICCQQVVAKKKIHPHRIQFNPIYPIVVVGDDRGHLTTLKLSPNLRILPKDTRNILLEGEVKFNFEINKMSKLLTLVRDPDTVIKPKFIPGPTNLTQITKPIVVRKC